MIKINLLPQRKRGVVRVGRAGGRQTMSPRLASDTGARDVTIGVAALGAVAALVFFLVHKRVADERDNYKQKSEDLQADITSKNKALKNFQNLKKLVAAAEERSAAIDKLVKAKSVPANLLHELGEILTPGKLPTMSQKMAKLISDGPGGDPNKRFTLDWDPKHVWITSFTEKDGVFTLKGGAQSDPDVYQLAKRMQASVYFMDVTPKGGQRTADKDTGTTYYDFTITGKVVY